LHILPNARVLKVNTNSTGGVATATGIQYSMTGGDLTGRTITANKEVILTGGAIGSPHMLMMSGIGPKANLESVGVQSVIDLPGVGQHVTDHVASEVIFKTTANTAATDRINQTLTNGTESFFSFVNSAIAYANITDLFGDYAPEFRDTIARNLTWAVENVCPSTDPTVQAGYRAVHEAGTENFILSPIGHVELLLGLTGTAQGGDDSIAIQAALQHPFSTGQIYLNSSNPWEYPVIDPNYLAHPADTWLIREGLKLARKIGNTAPLSNFMTSEVFPGTQVQTDAEWDAWLATQVKTEYHPSSSCSMMPLDHGGVVGADLKVHGTTNLRVADSSVFPVQFAAHLQSLTYGVGEIASEMIKNVSRTDRGEFRSLARMTWLMNLFCHFPPRFRNTWPFDKRFLPTLRPLPELPALTSRSPPRPVLLVRRPVPAAVAATTRTALHPFESPLPVFWRLPSWLFWLLLKRPSPFSYCLLLPHVDVDRFSTTPVFIYMHFPLEHLMQSSFL
jgi:choline dehydrogenase